MVSERLDQLEARSRELQPGAGERERLDRQALALAEGYYARMDEQPVLEAPEASPPPQWYAEFPEQGDSPERVFAELEPILARSGIKLGSGRLFGFIPGSGMHTAALGDLLAAVTNRYVGASFAAPEAVKLEHGLLRWLAAEIGYPDSATGDLTSGGSIANLTAIAAAREAQGIDPRDYERAPIYCTAQAHHCVDKALRILGLDRCPLRRVAMDAGYRMRPEALREAVDADRTAGRLPWLVIASAGTTDTGAVDPLDSIADIARDSGLWLHADGAYGAAFALCRPGRERLHGLARADSLIIDPHKGLFTPFGSGVVLVRNPEHLRAAMTERAAYMQDAHSLAGDHTAEPHDMSVELSRHFRGLRLWLPLRLHGVAPFRAALEEKLLLAEYFHQCIAALDGFEAGPAPDLSVVTFRYLPDSGDADNFNRRLVDTIQREGRVFLTSTVLDGRVVLRLAILAMATHREYVDEALEVLAETAGRVE